MAHPVLLPQVKVKAADPTSSETAMTDTAKLQVPLVIAAVRALGAVSLGVATAPTTPCAVVDIELIRVKQTASPAELA
jgi:hypothetical protein